MSKHHRAEEQEVRDLIVGAGPRAAVPAEDIAAIKAAAREEWRGLVEGERRQRRGARLGAGLALAASVLLALAVGWWWTTRTAPVAAPVVASVELVAGSVRGGGAELAVGGQLPAGVTVETGDRVDGPLAGTALRLAGGQSLRLAAGTRVRLASDRRFELDRGTLYVDSDPAASAGGVEVVTTLGIVRDIGTQFEVRVSEGDSTLRVRVREGEVALEAAGDSHRAIRGDQLSLLADGSIARAEIEPYGPEWDWVVATAPGLEFDGHPVGAVLSWYGRETGRAVRYADPALAAVADEAVLSGSSRGFTPAQTLETALRTSGLRHRLENGTILVGR